MVRSMKKQVLFRCLPLLLLAALVLCACSGKGNGDTPEGGVPDGSVRFENEALNYTFCYAENWEVDRSDGMAGIKCNVAGATSEAYASISVMSFTLGRGQKDWGANNYWDDYRSQLEDLYGEHISFESTKEECKLGGVIANRNRYTLQLSDMTYTYEQVICVRSGEVHLVTLTAPEGSYDKVIDCFHTVVDTFSFK